MSEVEQPPPQFRFSLLGLLLFMSLCAVLAATWPKELPVSGHRFLLIWTATVLGLLIAWRLAGYAGVDLPEKESRDATDRRIAYRLAQVGSLGPLGTWLLCYCFLALDSRLGSDEFNDTFLVLATITGFCLWLLLQAVSFIALLMSLTTSFKPRSDPPLSFLQTTVLILMAVQVLMTLAGGP